MTSLSDELDFKKNLMYSHTYFKVFFYRRYEYMYMLNSEWREGSILQFTIIEKCIYAV